MRFGDRSINITFMGIVEKIEKAYIRRDIKTLSERTQKAVEPYLKQRPCAACKGAADTGKTVKGRQKIVADGPYAEAKDVVNGYMLIEAADLPQAVELSKGCPILDAGGSVEVRPLRS